MANVTKERKTVYDGSTIYAGHLNDLNMPADSIAYAGSMRCADANQRAVAPSGANAALFVMGVVKETCDNRIASGYGAVDGKRVELMEGEFEFAKSGTNVPGAGDVGKDAFAEDDQTIGTLAAAGSKAGKILSVGTSFVKVGIGSKYHAV